MNKTFLLLFIAIIFTAFSQKEQADTLKILEQPVSSLEKSEDKPKKFTLSGYIQAQYQHAETDADGVNFKLLSRANAHEQENLENYGRFGIRRGRIKLSYDDKIASAVIQIDVTEKGISSPNVVTFKDVYFDIKDPWIGTNSLKVGVFNRPFGHEISLSSTLRESPERARIIQSIFPDERDLGAMLTLQTSKTSPWNILKLEGGLFVGNGIKPQFTSHFDFIGHLSITKTIGSNVAISGGVSAYLGGVFQNDSSVYVMKEKKFELESKTADNIGKYANRQYIGFDIQLSTSTVAGLTQLRGEYIFGKHPGNENGAYDFKFDDLPPVGNPIYMRKIAGGYVILAQNLGKIPLTAVVKYDWYNPNTEISGNDIATTDSGTGKRDITMSNIGVGLIWRIYPVLKLTAYYDFVNNETTIYLPNTKDEDGKITKYGYEDNRKDNVFTLRLQYQF